MFCLVTGAACCLFQSHEEVLSLETSRSPQQTNTGTPDELEQPLMQNFHLLDEVKKVEFNEALNNYIKKLPETWEAILDADADLYVKTTEVHPHFKC